MKSVAELPVSAEISMPLIVLVGAVVSMTNALFAPSEFAAAGDGRVKVATLSEASFIVPLFSPRELVAT